MNLQQGQPLDAQAIQAADNRGANPLGDRAARIAEQANFGPDLHATGRAQLSQGPTEVRFGAAVTIRGGSVDPIDAPLDCPLERLALAAGMILDPQLRDRAGPQRKRRHANAG